MAALREFVADLLESEGAAVDPVEPEALDVLAPEPVRAAMGWPEIVRLAFGASRPEGATPVGLEGDWLERFGTLLGERGRLAERRLVLPHEVAPPGEPERMLDRALDLPNAIWRLKGAAPAIARCLLLAFRYTAISDEKREGLLWLGFNQSTGACLDGPILERLQAVLAGDADWQAPDPEVRAAAGTGWDAPALAARVSPLLEHRVRHDLEPFLRAMRRRLERDRDRVHAYHDDLHRAAQLKLHALDGAAGEKAEADRKRESLRIAAVEREYAAKLDDLRHNYALRVTVCWVQALTLFAPVHRYQLLIRRRKGERMVEVDWHAAARTLERLPTEWGPGVEAARLVCDERLHLTDVGAQAPCTGCGKGWCRACHPAACPRCRPARERQGGPLRRRLTRPSGPR
jgi:hypothetical protein